MQTIRQSFCLLALLVIGSSTAALAAAPTWTFVSSKDGNLPPPNGGQEQTASLVLDVDKDGIDDFVITERTQGPSVVWYKYAGNRKWDRRVIEPEPLHIEAGGDVWDIDGDGDLDIMFSGDYKSDGVWWWENPQPKLDAKSWTRHTIKSGDGAHSQHDSRFGDFDGDGRTELAWWSKPVRQLLLAEIPEKPREAKSWNNRPIFTYRGTPHEGMDVADINLDGKPDIVGAGYWFEHVGGDKFEARRITDRPFTRSAVGQLVPGGRPEVVIVPGDADGRVEWFQWDGKSWVGRELLANVVHGHSVEIADVNRDGHLDVFIGEMGKPGAGPQCKARLLWGDGAGKFQEQVIAVGKANHESRLGDFDGNGKLDILGKPYSYETPSLHLWLQN